MYFGGITDITDLSMDFMAGQPTPSNVHPPRNKGLIKIIKGLLTIGFP